MLQNHPYARGARQTMAPAGGFEVMDFSNQLQDALDRDREAERAKSTAQPRSPA